MEDATSVYWTTADLSPICPTRPPRHSESCKYERSYDQGITGAKSASSQSGAVVEQHPVAVLSHFKRMPAAAANFHIFNSEWLCATCPSHDVAFCRDVAQTVKAHAVNVEPLKAFERIVSAKYLIFRQGESLDTIPIICKGWATSEVTLGDGRSQILSFLLPGDMISTALFFDTRIPSTIRSITDVQLRAFSRNQLKQLMASNSNLFDAFSRAWLQERSRIDQLAVDLGQRSAEERIANLILNLFERLNRIGLTRDNTLEFPLRQRHISRYAGLTVVHVSRILSDFRNKGLILHSERTLTIIDLAGLRHLAGIR